MIPGPGPGVAKNPFKLRFQPLPLSELFPIKFTTAMWAFKLSILTFCPIYQTNVEL